MSRGVQPLVSKKHPEPGGAGRTIWSLCPLHTGVCMILLEATAEL